MTHLLGLVAPLDPLHGDGYNWWSGLGSGSPIIAGLLLFWRRHNCHQRGCPLVSWHESEAHDGHPVCRLHHRDHHGPLSRLFARVGLAHGGSRPV